MSLPPELIDTVIDNILHDKPALAACSVVSRGWTFRSRLHLFRSITFHPKPGGDGTTPLLQFLKSSPALAKLVHELILEGSPADAFSITTRDTENISHAALYRILDFLPSLSNLELRRLCFTRPHNWTIEEYQETRRAPSHPMDLHSLTLDLIGDTNISGVVETNAFEIQGILAAFSSVRELRSHNLEFRRYPLNWPSTEHRSPLYGQNGPVVLMVRDCSPMIPLFQGIWHVSVKMISVNDERFL